jgi:sensor histidine kinase regulating citrate/malate metabolism
LCVLFGNLLENALEACRRLDADEKYIRFAVNQNKGFITVVSDNSFDGGTIKDGGIFHSRKRPGPGIGTASIKAIAGKYGGYAEFSAEKREFRVSVVLIF